MRAIPTLALVVAGLAALASGPLTRDGGPLSATFRQVEQDVFRFNLWWHPVPGILAPATVWLIREPQADGSAAWVLIDAGMADRWTQAWNRHLVGALKRTVPAGQLKAVVLTHSHSDHVGGLPGVLAAFPEAAVVVHEAAAPFLAGEAEYVEEARAPRALRLLRALGLAERDAVKVPRDRLHLLRAADAPEGAPSTEGLRAAGVDSLAWIPTPGHGPGHVSYLHQPSGAVLAGDALLLMEPRLAWGPPAAAGGAAQVGLAYEYPLTWAIVQMIVAGDLSSFSSLPADVARGGGWLVARTPLASLYLAPSLFCPEPKCDHEAYQRSVCHLAQLPGWRRLYPNHDMTAKGLSREALAAFASTLPACRA